jgi:hypothetical protein
MATSDQTVAYVCSSCGWIAKEDSDACIHCDVVFSEKTLRSSIDRTKVPCQRCVNSVVSISCKENCEPNSKACLKYYSAQLP